MRYQNVLSRFFGIGYETSNSNLHVVLILVVNFVSPSL
jgi:hypothetical protein